MHEGVPRIASDSGEITYHEGGMWLHPPASDPNGWSVRLEDPFMSAELAERLNTAAKEGNGRDAQLLMDDAWTAAQIEGVDVIRPDENL